MVELVALCGLLGLFGIWRKDRARKQKDAESKSSATTATKEANKEAGATSVKAKYSIHSRCIYLPRPAVSNVTFQCVIELQSCTEFSMFMQMLN